MPRPCRPAAAAAIILDGPALVVRQQGLRRERGARRENHVHAAGAAEPLEVGDEFHPTGAAELGMKGMGKVMAQVTPQTKGRADGSLVAAEVKRQLSA